MNLKEVDTFELIDRYTYLIEKYVQLALELAPKLEKFGKLKNELQMITSEFVERGVNPEDPEPLKKLIQQEIEKRANTDEQKEVDKA